MSKIVITPEARLSFPHIIKPSVFKGNTDKARYEVNLIFNKDQDLSGLKNACTEALNKEWPDPKKRPKTLGSPFKKGSDREQFEGYDSEKVYIVPWSRQRPGIMDSTKTIITDLDKIEELLYAGCYVRVSIQAFTYNESGNCGVAFALNNIIKIKDGERFSGKSTPEEDFADIEIKESVVSSDAELEDAFSQLEADTEKKSEEDQKDDWLNT